MSPPSVSGRRLATSSVTLLVEYGLRMGMTAVVSFWIARQLGPEEFGILNAASALTAIFTIVAALGADVPVTLRLSRGGRDGAVISTAIAMRTAASALCVVVLWAIAWAVEHDDPKVLAVMLIVAMSVLGQAPNIFDHWFKARVQAGTPAAMRLLGTLLVVGAKALCLLLGGGVVALAWTVVFEAVVNSLVMWLAWRGAARGLVPDPMKPDAALARTLAGESLPYLGSNVATIVHMKLDVVMLSRLSTHAQTGVYSLVQKLSEVLYIVPVVIVDTVYPALSRRHDVPGDHIARDGQLLFDLTCAASTVAVVLGIVLGGPLISLTFGDRYAEAIPLFAVHATTCIAVALNVSRLRWLATLGLQRHAPALTVIGAVINAALNLAMIPAWGAWGAVGAAVLSCAFGSFLSSFLWPALRPVGVMQARALWPWPRLIAFARASRATRTARP